jgi:hypothetical protein
MRPSKAKMMASFIHSQRDLQLSGNERGFYHALSGASRKDTRKNRGNLARIGTNFGFFIESSLFSRNAHRFGLVYAPHNLVPG